MESVAPCVGQNRLCSHEDDLQILTDGIPISQLPLLGRWPNGPMTGGSGVTGTAVARESFGPSPGA